MYNVSKTVHLVEKEIKKFFNQSVMYKWKTVVRNSTRDQSKELQTARNQRSDQTLCLHLIQNANFKVNRPTASESHRPNAFISSSMYELRPPTVLTKSTWSAQQRGRHKVVDVK